MRFNRLKLQHGYHDAMVSAIRYRDRDVILDVDLCGCCNPSPGPATIIFQSVRNFDVVHQALESARRANSHREYIDEIIGIVRGDNGGFLLDLQTAGCVTVVAGSIFEA